jgi:hypothetical protein
LSAGLLLSAFWPIRRLKRKRHPLAGTKPFDLYQIFIVNTRFLGFNRIIIDAMANSEQIRHL